MFTAPKMNSSGEKSAAIVPVGGLNTSVLSDRINDNQSPDMLNMWVKNNALVMRPGLKKKIEQQYGKVLDVSRELLIKRVTTRINGEITNVTEIRGVYIVTTTSVLSYDGAAVNVIGTGTFERCCLVSANKSSVYDSGMVPGASIVQKIHYEADAVYLLGDGLLYSIRLYRTGVPPFYTYTIKLVPVKYKAASDPVTTDPKEYPYIPTIAINCKPDGSGDTLEDRNYLTPTVKQTFTTDSHSTVYQLYDKSIDYQGSMGKTVTVTCNMLNNTTNKWEFNETTTSAVSGGISAQLDTTNGTITFGAALVDAASANAANNMTVQYSKTLYESNNPVRNCNLAIWFGGVRQGQESGDNLLVSGNPDKPNALYSSSPTSDGSLYFPETSVNYLGTPVEAITALTKMFNVLIVLKERSLHRISYEYDSDQKKYIFPAQEVHSGIGCDMPESVQIINNYLVWANSTGGVYTLLSTSVKDERIVRPVSKNINSLLLSHTSDELQTAVSVDTGYYYMIFVGHDVFLWNYLNTPYANSSDFDSAQMKLSWFQWTIPKQAGVAFLFDGTVFMCAAEDNSLYFVDENESTDDGVWYPVYWMSKAFDMGAPQYMKQPYRCVFSLLNQVGIPVRVLFQNESGETAFDEILERSNTQTQKSITIRNLSDWSQNFSFGVKRVDGELNSFGISSIVFYYKLGRMV